MSTRPKTKAPAPSRRLKDPRNEALERMTKAELLKTVKALDKKQTALLNQLAAARDAITPEAIQRAVAAHRAQFPPPSPVVFNGTPEELAEQRHPTPKPHPAPAEAVEAEQNERRRVFGPFPWEK